MNVMAACALTNRCCDLFFYHCHAPDAPSGACLRRIESMDGARLGDEAPFGGLFARPEALTQHLKAIGLADGPRMLLEQLWYTSQREGCLGARQVSIPRMARELGVCQRSIINWRDELIAYGFLETFPPPKGRTLILVIDLSVVWSCERVRREVPDHSADVTPYLVRHHASHHALDHASDHASDVAKHHALDHANDDAPAAHTSFDLDLKDLSINLSPDIQSERSNDPSDFGEGEELPLAAFEAATPPGVVHALTQRWFDASPDLQHLEFDAVLGAVLAARARDDLTEYAAYVRKCLENGLRDGWLKRARDLIDQVAPQARPLTAAQQQLALDQQRHEAEMAKRFAEAGGAEVFQQQLAAWRAKRNSTEEIST